MGMDGQRFNNPPELKTFRRELREHMTPAEARMWTHLQKKQLDGRRFKRQHGFSGYILDFYCPTERLAIELDGQPHLESDAREKDLERDVFLKYFGIMTLRFENHMVFDRPEWVLDQIRGQFGWYKRHANTQ